MTLRYFHFSEDPAITRFVPRPAKPAYHTLPNPVVWAVSDQGVWKYLFPRECPRVAFCASSTSTTADIAAYLAGEPKKRVVGIEAAWLERCLATTLYRYELRPDNFRLYDAVAHYYISQAEEVPVDVISIPSPLRQLVQIGVEVRITPSLWALQEQILASSLAWSFIRMQNATMPERLQGS